MARGTRANIRWTDTISQNIDRLRSSVAADILEQAAQRGATIVRDAAAAAAPRRTGKLANSIIMETRQKTHTRCRVAVGPHKEVFYGWFVEFGTKNMAARPFLTPAYRQNRGAIREAIRQTLEQAIQDALRR